MTMRGENGAESCFLMGFPDTVFRKRKKKITFSGNFDFSLLSLQFPQQPIKEIVSFILFHCWEKEINCWIFLVCKTRKYKPPQLSPIQLFGMDRDYLESKTGSDMIQSFELCD